MKNDIALIQEIMKDGTGDRQSNLEVIQIVARIKQRLQVAGEINVGKDPVNPDQAS